MAIAFGLGFLFVLALSQTAWGRSQILAYTLRTLGGRLNGELAVQRLEGNVITGARLYDILVTDAAGAPLAAADSAYIQYRIASFLGGDVVIHRLVAYDARVELFRMPGDTVWNYQEVLTDPTPDATDGTGADAGATLLESLTLIDSEVSVRRPLEPDPRLSQEAQDARMEEMLADTSYVLEEVPGGYLRTTIIDIEQVGAEELFIGPTERGGTYAEIVNANADVYFRRDPPLEVREGRGQLHLREGVLEFRVPEVVLPNSRGEGLGSIDFTSGRPMYNLFIDSPSFSLSDLRWLYPWLPDDPEAGGGSAEVRIEDRAEGRLVLARDLLLEMPGTEVTGDFGLISGPESVRFIEVELEANPLRVESVEALFPDDLPVQGLVIGGATIRGVS
ncbi:MAG: hypothetical protein GEU90_19850 [Gemmatimonas sp.]|nr:hypothetical protein [Gemmatimonas sp.]